MLGFQKSIPFLGPMMPDYIIDQIDHLHIGLYIYNSIELSLMSPIQQSELILLVLQICLLETLTTPVGTSSSQLAID